MDVSAGELARLVIAVSPDHCKWGQSWAGGLGLHKKAD